MPHCLHPIRLFPLCALFCALPAQTFVVDAAGGPGSSFTSIATAVANVPDGAVLLVLPGFYAGFTIDAKSVAVLGQPGVIVADPLTQVVIRNLAAGQAVTLHGLEIESGIMPVYIDCQSCVGEVVVQSCRVVPPPFSLLGGGLSATQCSRVRVVDSEFVATSGSTVLLDRSFVSLSATTCRPGALGDHGVRLFDSSCEIAGCLVDSGGFLAGAAVAFAGGTCSARLLGATQLVTTGAASASAVSGVGTLRIDPSVQLVTGTATPIGAGVVVITEVMPVVAASTGALGGTANGTLTGPSGGGQPTRDRRSRGRSDPRGAGSLCRVAHVGRRRAQLRAPGRARRRTALGAPQGRLPREPRRTRHHPGFDGHGDVPRRRAWPRGFVAFEFAWRRSPAGARRGDAADLGAAGRTRPRRRVLRAAHAVAAARRGAERL